VHTQAAGAAVLLFISFLLFCIGAGLPAWRTLQRASTLETIDGELYSADKDRIPDEFEEAALKFDCTLGSGLFQFNAHSGKCGDPKQGPEGETTEEATIRMTYWDSFSTSPVCKTLKPWELNQYPGQPDKEVTDENADCESIAAAFCQTVFKDDDCKFAPVDDDIVNQGKLSQQKSCIMDPFDRFCVEKACPDLNIKKDSPDFGYSKAERGNFNATCGSLRTMQAFAILAVLFSFLAFAVSAGAASGAMKNLAAPAVLAFLACICGVAVFGVYDRYALQNDIIFPPGVTGTTLFDFTSALYQTPSQKVYETDYGPAFGAEVAGFVTSGIAFLLLTVGAAAGGGAEK
jgi:hypothetical protein